MPDFSPQDGASSPRGAPRFDLADEHALRVIRGLAESIGDTIVVVDAASRVVAWNGAAETLYGIPAGQAIGASIFELTDSTVVGEAIPRNRPWELAVERGLWRGRTIDVPLLGPLTSREVTVEVILSPIHGLDGKAAGVVCIKRDVTAAVRLERDLAALGSLVSMTGGGRPIAEVARRAVEILTEATGATVGSILRITRDRIVPLADIGIDPEIRALYGSIAPGQSPLVTSVRQPGTVVSGDVRSIRMLPAVAENLTHGGIRTAAAVGLHRADELVGVLFLGWADPTVARPSSAVLLQASSHIERGLSNAAVAGEAAERADADRALARRLQTLDDLTRAGEAARTVDELAERTAAEVRTAIGAIGVVYVLFDGPGEPGLVRSTGLPAAAADALTGATTAANERAAWAGGAGSRLATLPPGDTSIPGAASRACVPIRVDGELVGAIGAAFDRPADQLAVDEASLDSVARIASISLANFRLRERLERSESRYRMLFEASPQAMFVVDAEDQLVTHANDAAGRLLGRPTPDFVGTRLTALGPFDDAWVADQLETLRTVGRVTFEQRGFRPDGTTFPALVEAALVEIDGRPRILAVARDLTDSERLQSELVQAQKMEAISQLVAGVAHELNNPLTAIIAFSRFVRDSADLPEELRSDAELLVGEADRTQRIVRNLLDFARQRAPERVATRLPDLVDVVLDLQAYAFRTGRVHLRVDVPDDLPAIEIDRGQISQVILNLTLNAVEAIRTSDPGTGTVTIEAAAAADDAGHPVVRLSITDDGPGVAPEDVEHLFTPFFTTKAPGDGTGLGLAVSFGIAASHGGRLTHQPNPAGRGARFVLEIPVGERATTETTAAAPAVEATAAPASAGPPSVLVLDDEVSIRRLLEKALTSAGMAVTPAAEGGEAVELCRDRSFDAILCDHRMAGMDGTEVFAALAEIRPDLLDRFVFMSGDVMNPELAVFAEQHGTRMLEKPFLIEDVVRLVREVVATPARAESSDQPRG